MKLSEKGSWLGSYSNAFSVTVGKLITFGESNMNHSSRISQLRSMLDESSGEILIVSNLTNIRYLTGFTGSAGLLIVSSNRHNSAVPALLLTDGRYQEQSARETKECQQFLDIFIGSPERQIESAVKFIGSSTKTMIDPYTTTVAQFNKWTDSLGNRPLESEVGIETLRRIKDSDEIELIRKASRIADKALIETLPQLLHSPTEVEFAAELDYNMRKLGAEGPSFETIVASGENSAMPHARPTLKTIREGEVVVIDFGATVEGYHSDCTRTYYLASQAPAEFDRAYNAVSEAQHLGCQAAAKEVEISRIDKTCRETLDSYGMLELFTHGTGHGVGLEIHELPWVSSGNSIPLEQGDVITVEPGVYLEGKFGIRIEDTLAINQDSFEQLTQIAKSPYLA